MIAGTAAAVPFVQAIATQAGGDVYDKVRELFRRAIGRKSGGLTETIDRTNGPELYVVGDSATNTWLEMRGHATDEALGKLAETDLEALAAPDPQGRTVTVCWDPGAEEWQRRVAGD